MPNHTKISNAEARKWGSLASFLLAATFIIAPLIYFLGDWRDALGRFAYNLADFLYGPMWGASLITLVFVLRERLGERAPRRMSMALLAAVLAAGAAVLVALIRSANRQYHLIHPELHLETDSTVLIVWTTLVSGMTAASWHFLGWALVLVGSSGWTSGRLPHLLSALYVVTGISSLFVYLLPNADATAGALGVIVSIWQGILLWRTKPQETQAPEINSSQPEKA
jgi:hypothetical protein